MKKHQFEEITMALSVIIALLAYQFNVNWLFYIFTVKAIFDCWCALTYSYKAAVKERIKKIDNEKAN